MVRSVLGFCHMAAKVSIHTKRYYRVILQSIDEARENRDSFAIKLSVQTSTPLPRARTLLRQMPVRVKNGITVDQANRLKTLLEAMGGVVRVESYFVTPGEEEKKEPVQIPVKDDVVERVCRSCGEGVETDLDICPFCKQPMSARDDNQIVSAVSRTNEYTPQATEPADSASASPADLLDAVRENKFLIIAGLIAILLVIAIFKQ